MQGKLLLPNRRNRLADGVDQSEDHGEEAIDNGRRHCKSDLCEERRTA